MVHVNKSNNLEEELSSKPDSYFKELKHELNVQYKNNDDWGYVDYNKVDINDNTVLVYGKDASLEYE